MVKAVPDGYHTLTPYLTVPDGEAMLRFLQGVFGAKLTERLNDSSGTLKHAELQLGDSKVMVGQASEQYKPRPQTLYVYLPDVDATYKGQPFPQRFRLTTVWTRQKSEWLIKLEQGTIIPEPAKNALPK